MIMSLDFEEIIQKIDEKKRSRRIKYFIFTLFGLILLAILYGLYYMHLINLTLFYNLSVILIVYPIFYYTFSFITPLPTKDRIFLELIEILDTMQNLKKTTIIQSRKKAHKKFMKTYDKFSSLIDYRPSWHSGMKKIEDEFLKNLKERVAPAILNGQLTLDVFNMLIKAFYGDKVEEINKLNELIENSYEKETPKENKVLILYFQKIESWVFTSIIGKIIFSFLTGFLLPNLFFSLLTLILQMSYIELLKNNLITIVSLCLTISLAIVALLFKK
jgi:hypothetical protein